MKIIPVQDGVKIFNENKVIGYVEHDILFGMDRDGYAVEICRIDDNSEIIGALTTWRKDRQIGMTR